jgi:hypothetical protein
MRWQSLAWDRWASLLRLNLNPPFALPCLFCLSSLSFPNNFRCPLTLRTLKCAVLRKAPSSVQYLNYKEPSIISRTGAAIWPKTNFGPTGRPHQFVHASWKCWWGILPRSPRLRSALRQALAGYSTVCEPTRQVCTTLVKYVKGLPHVGKRISQLWCSNSSASYALLSLFFMTFLSFPVIQRFADQPHTPTADEYDLQ